MTSANTDYGTILGKIDSTSAYPALGEVVLIDAPELINAAVEATNHSSGGHREFIPSGLQEMSEFKATINAVAADVAKLVTDLQAGTKAAYQISFPNGHKEKFSALVTGIKPLTADAQTPDVQKIEATFRPTDSLSFSS
jgi:hypothetical protein